MASLPETQYAKSGDLHIAYQLTGSGPLDSYGYPASCRISERIP